MKKIREQLELFSIEVAKALGFIVGLLPASIYIFIGLELFLFYLCHTANLEVFVIQFPITLWVVLGGSKKDGNK